MLTKKNVNIKLMKKYEIKYLVELENNASGEYDNKYMKISLNSNDSLSLKQGLEMYNIVIIIRSIFYGSNKNYPTIFLDQYL